MHKKIIRVVLSAVTPVYLFLPALAFAQIPPPAGGPRSVGELFNLFISILGWVFSFAVVLAILLIIWGGVTYMTAGGDDTKIGNAKKRIIWGLVGVAIIIGAWAIIYIVASILNIQVQLPFFR